MQVLHLPLIAIPICSIFDCNSPTIAQPLIWALAAAIARLGLKTTRHNTAQLSYVLDACHLGFLCYHSKMAGSSVYLSIKTEDVKEKETTPDLLIA